MSACFHAYGTAFLRGCFSLKNNTSLRIRISCDPTAYLKTYCMPLRTDGHDGNWLMGNSFIRFRLWFDGKFISCGPLRSIVNNTRVVHEFELNDLAAGEHFAAVAFRGDRDGVSVEIFDGEEQIQPTWKIFDARLFYAPLPWRHPNFHGYFKGDIGPGENFEHIDGLIAPDGWNTDLQFNDSAWTAPEIVQSDLQELPAEYNYTVEIQKPVKIWKLENGVYIADFGKTAIGSISLKGPAAGGEVELGLGDELRNGRVRHQLRCLVCYQELWTFRPGGQHLEHFGVRCFRYAELVGYQGELTGEELQRVVISAPFNDTGVMKTDHPYLPKVWELCRTSVRNLTADYFVDCFTRERIPYEADAHLTIGSSYVMNSDLRVVKRTLEHFLDHPTWPCDWALEMALLFYDYYLETGDIEFIRPRLDKLVSYCGFRNLIKDGMIRKYPLIILLDWPMEYQAAYDMADCEYLTATNALSSRVLSMLSELAAALGRDALAAELEADSKAIAETINKCCFDSEKQLYKDRPDSDHCSMYANMWALWCGIVPEEKVGPVIDFVENYGMNCSLYSGYFYLETLFRYGRGKSAFALLSGADSRWMDMINADLTTTTEYWYQPNEAMNLSHPWGAYPVYLIAKYVFGVKQTAPGWKDYVVEPDSTFEFAGTLDMVRNGVTIHAERK